MKRNREQTQSVGRGDAGGRVREERRASAERTLRAVEACPAPLREALLLTLAGLVDEKVGERGR